uniref:Gag/pol protein n=1 Tax=Cucumis melo TaxID=3656 RepID=A0A9I9E9S3_CUCME
MLVYDTKDLILTRYTDSDFQTDKDARKSISGSIFTLNGGSVVWRCEKQTCIADSTMEAEYIWKLFQICICQSLYIVTTVVQLQIDDNLEALNRESISNTSWILNQLFNSGSVGLKEQDVASGIKRLLKKLYASEDLFHYGDVYSRQLDSVGCGYYVQNYIHEIVHNSSTSITSLLLLVVFVGRDDPICGEVYAGILGVDLIPLIYMLYRFIHVSLLNLRFYMPTRFRLVHPQNTSYWERFA